MPVLQPALPPNETFKNHIKEFNKSGVRLSGAMQKRANEVCVFVLVVHLCGWGFCNMIGLQLLISNIYIYLVYVQLSCE